MTVLGIDEAGRGPVLGPLVIGLAEWKSSHGSKLEENGLKLRDSKKLSESQRKATYEVLRENLQYSVCCIPAWVIARPGESIPQLEARVIKEALRNFGDYDVYCDALGSGDRAHRWIKNEYPRRSFCFESGADDTYPAVSAASVLAKVTRDNILETLQSDWGELGSGYPSDPTTKAWLETWDQASDWPAFVRTSWSTIERLNE